MMSSKSLYLMVAASLFILSGCANREGVSPSQNASLQTISPSNSASEGGAMQRSLDAWLKEEWTPLTATPQNPEPKTVSESTPAASATPVPSAAVSQDDEPFTLQKYADKWKVYHENKARMNEGKPKEPSHTEMMNTLPAVGK